MDMADAHDDTLTLDAMLRVPHAFYGVTHQGEGNEHIEL